MSYTAPTYVDTKEQAILALASTIKGEAVTGGDGSVNRALDLLADVLAEQDVQVPQTDAGAILALAQYVGGGGGPSLGRTAPVVATFSLPAVGGDPFTDAQWLCIDKIFIGDMLAATAGDDPFGGSFASGLTLSTMFFGGLNACAGYICTIAEGEYASVAPWSGTITTTQADNDYAFTFTMPELNEGEYLFLNVYED